MSRLRNKYGLFDLVYLGVCLFRCKCISKSIRLIRFPIDIRGKRSIDFGRNLTTGRRCRFDVFEKQTREKVLRFGDNVQINDCVHIVCMESVIIGNNVLMASNIFISDCSHGSYKGDENDTSPIIPPVEREYSSAPVCIKDNVWIGEGVVIMPGVTIGEGSVIGAHTIVNRDVPKYSVAVGAPMRIIKKYNFETKRWERV